MRILTMSLMLTACDGGTLCGAGLHEVDGECVDDDTDSDTETETETETETREPTLEDVLIDAQPCDGLNPGERIDIYAGCADDVCAKGSLRDAVQAMGRQPTCGSSGGNAWVPCAWPSGITANIYDGNDNGQADPDEWVYWVEVAAPFGGADANGLGLGISPGCFVERFGAPNTTTLYEADDGKPRLSYGYWEESGLVIVDQQGGPQPYQPDGRVDALRLFGGDGTN